jgi:hypothetical protein
MLPNTITLPVDVLNNGTTVDKVYTRFREEAEKSLYYGPNNTLTARNILQFYRTLNKRVGNSFGVARTAQKLTVDILTDAPDGTEVSQACIIELNSSFPAGITPAKALELRQTMIALIDSALMVDVHSNLMV